MSLAESPASARVRVHRRHQQHRRRILGTRRRGTAGARVPANHLMDTVLPVRPALVDRGSAARLKPGMLEDLLRSGAARAMVLSGRQALVSGNSLVLLDAAELAEHLRDTAYAPEQLIYLGSALPGSDLDAGTELVLFVLPQQFEVRAEEFEPTWPASPTARSGPGFRDVAARLNPTDTALFIEASAIANWHATHTHCPRCGTPTQPEAGGWVRRCPADGSEHLPADRSGHHRHRRRPGRPAAARRRRSARRPELFHPRRLRRTGGVARTGRACAKSARKSACGSPRPSTWDPSPGPSPPP